MRIFQTVRNDKRRFHGLSDKQNDEKEENKQTDYIGIYTYTRIPIYGNHTCVGRASGIT